jgi:twitching motility two-component system response regulator PilH
MSPILVVEDSPTIRYTLGKMLTDKGYEVITAGDGEQAVTMAAENQPQLIILDVILPRLNGYQVCRRLKSSEATSNTPVIMLTSKSKESEREWGMAQGADAYLFKPVDADRLYDLVSQFIAEAG